MHDTLKRLHRRERGTGTTIDRFLLNELVSQLAFGGRRGRVYRRIVSLAGVRSGDSVLDVGCSSGYLARKLAAAAGPAGHVTGVDPSQAAIAYARRHASRAMTFTVGVAQDLPCRTRRSTSLPARSPSTMCPPGNGRRRSLRCTG
jgi:2-polyprenyl-3-methyl-5-hydroxy-6-metoxy-1,4-benzoquinol methylase